MTERLFRSRSGASVFRDGSKVRTRAKKYAKYATQQSFKDIPAGAEGVVEDYVVGAVEELRVEFRLPGVLAIGIYRSNELELLEE
jgi:hypothetical protein